MQIFTALFAIEAILKMVGLGIRRYFRSSWNKFDFCIVIVSVASVILENRNVRGTNFMRAFRLVRTSFIFTSDFSFLSLFIFKVLL